MLKRFFQSVPSSLAVLALAMQVVLPMLHAPHAPLAGALDGAAAIESAAAHPHDETGHDAASCSQCRLVSQLGTLAPHEVATAAPALHAGWLASGGTFALRSAAERDSGPPRAPPFLA